MLNPRMVVACNRPGGCRLRSWLSNWWRGLRPNLRSGQSTWKVPTSCSQASPQRTSRTRGRNRRGKRLSFVCIVVHDIDVEVVERSSLARACALESSPVLGVVWVWASRIHVYSQSTLSCPSSRPACRKRYHEEPIINARVAFGTFDFGLTSSLSSIYVDSDVHAVQVGRCAVWQRQVRDEGADECRMARQPRGTDVRVAGNSGQNQLHLQVPC